MGQPLKTASPSRYPQPCSVVGVERHQAIWDNFVFDTLVGHVGVDKMDASLRMFSALLGQKIVLLEDSEIGVPGQRFQIHDLASVSGFLGFQRLFEACSQFLEKKRSHVRCRKAVVTEIQKALDELTVYLAARPASNTTGHHHC